jgi:hypothetical protein
MPALEAQRGTRAALRTGTPDKTTVWRHCRMPGCFQYAVEDHGFFVEVKATSGSGNPQEGGRGLGSNE